MRLVHWQIYAATATVVAVGALVLLVQASGDNNELRRQLESERQRARRPVPAARPAPRPAATPESADAGLLRGRIAQLERKLAALRTERDRLQRENEALKKAVAAATRTDATATSGSAPASGRTAAPPTGPLGAAGIPGTAPPATGPAHPVPLPEPSGEPWGASTEGELDKLAGALGLDQPQREEVKRFIIEAQTEFERRLIEASQSGERDISIIERIGQEISKKTELRIRQILRPEQQSRFDEYLAEQQQQEHGD